MSLPLTYPSISLAPTQKSEQYNLRIIIQDHLDSFTYNIAEYFHTYSPNILVNNFSQYIRPKDMRSSDLLVLGPGPCTPGHYPQISQLLQEKLPCPVLGICLGHQALGIHLGGELISTEPKFGVTENFYFKSKKTKHIYTRYHAWSLRFSSESTVEILSKSSVDQAVMAFRNKSKNIYGVQFHPESIGSKIPIKYLLEDVLDINWML